MKVIRGIHFKYVPASHENPDAPGVVKKVLVGNDIVPEGKIMMINWCMMPKKHAFIRHMHQDMTEIYIIMTGRGKITVGNETSVVSSGDAVIIEPQNEHEMVNAGDNDMKYLAIGIAHGDKGKTVLTQE